jgi:flagellar assembly factor FliW
MHLETVHFGVLPCSAGDILLFPAGVKGCEHLHTWLLLEERPLVWLQSVEDPRVALPLVSPFLFVPEYRFSLPRDQQELTPKPDQRAVILVGLSQPEGQWVINLRAPLLFWPELRLGRQVISANEQPSQIVLPFGGGILRKSA